VGGTAARRIEVHHCGPASDEVGGMATVIATMAEHAIGADHVAMHATWSMHSRARTLRWSAAALATIARLPGDAIVHVHLSEGGSFVREGALVLAARARRLRTAVTLHGADFVAFAQRRRALVARVLNSASLITCLSADYVALVGELAPRPRVAVVPNPVLIDPGPPNAAATPPTALFAGELSHRKGIDVLLAAWPAVRAAVPDAECVLVGPRADVDVPELAGVSVRAPVAQREVRALVRAARCVVLPSRAEALPMTLLEAMACARPFVSTPVGGIASLAEGGTLVPVGDAPALAAALVELLDHPDLAQEVGARGQASCARTRGLDVVDAQLRELYAALLARG
jgi:glycosyltransferase involved in cell wall biosynthesis